MPEGVFCPQCAYDLRGSTSPRCPECGHPLEQLRTTGSQIPWIHRRQLGLFRAYWRTARMVTFRNRQFCAEFARPVSYTDAQKFRWLTVGLAYGAILCGKLAHWLMVPGAFKEQFGTIEWSLVPVEAATFLTLAALTGSPSYYFHPRRLPLVLQNRAVALSYYTCAPLGWLPLALIPTAAVHLLRAGGVPFFLTGSQTGILLALITMLIWWRNLVQLAARTLRAGIYTALVAVGVPIVWISVGGHILVGLPLLTLYVAAIFYTLR